MVSFFYLETFLRAYLYTISIEFAVCYSINRRISFERVLWVVMLVNAFSLFFVWFIFPTLSVTYDAYSFVSESFAVVSEALLMRALLPISIRRAFATSFAQNMASFIFGLLFPWAIL